MEAAKNKKSIDTSLLDIDLSQYFSLSPMFILKKSLGIICLLIFILCLGVYGGDLLKGSADNMREALGLPPLFLYYTACAVLIISNLYWYLYLRAFRFGIKDGMFYIQKGVVVKDIFDYPVTSIENTGVKRTLLDSLFGLCTVQIMTAHEASDDLAAIRGISIRSGHQLHRYLRKLVQTHQSSRLDIQELMEEIKAVGVNKLPIKETGS